MKISILTDNHPGVNTPAEHGLSYIIEYDGKRLLFDAGQSEMFLKNSKIELAGKYELVTSDQPCKISEKIFFLGEIPRLTDFESQTTPFVFEDGSPGYVPDDSAVTIILQEGLFVITVALYCPAIFSKLAS